MTTSAEKIVPSEDKPAAVKRPALGRGLMTREVAGPCAPPRQADYRPGRLAQGQTSFGGLHHSSEFA